MAPGSLAPNFEYKDINVKSVSLKSLRGKLVYVDVWGTWCIPCKQEIPYLKKVKKQYIIKILNL